MARREFQIRSLKRFLAAEAAKSYYRPARPAGEIFSTRKDLAKNRRMDRHEGIERTGQLEFDFREPLEDIFPEAYQ